MKVTAQEEYGIRCMMQLARVGPERAPTLEDIAKLEGISEPYVAKLLHRLSRKGLVTSTRGRRGGYALARPASQIRMYEVFEALGQPFFESPSYCQTHVGALDVCAHTGDCSLRSLLRAMNTVIVQILRNTRLSDLASCNERGMDDTLHTVHVTRSAASV